VAFLLDTNVVCEARGPAADPNVRAWLSALLHDYGDRIVRVTAEAAEE
jgi:predicted nucleic acid-binding protein